MRHVNASRKKMGLPLVMRAAWLRECCGYACLSGVAYDDKTGCTAHRRSKVEGLQCTEKTLKIYAVVWMNPLLMAL